MSEPSPGLYVHVPFCRSKCGYCGFYSVVGGAHERYVEALGEEARTSSPAWSGFDTCYVGGGTPSVLADDLLEQLVESMRRALCMTDGAEWTLEVNPADVTPERARTWRTLGFRRVSVGVQSFRAHELAWLGRRHVPQQARQALGWLRAAGFDDLGIDLVQGLPGQSLSERFASVDGALGFEPEHLSVYDLTLEPETPLAGAAKAGRFVPLAEDAAANGWLATSEHLRARGYLHYEVSNFARDAAHRSRHNRKYWTGDPYLGLGPAAHSFDGQRRWHNLRSVEGYCDALESGRQPIAGEESLSDEQLRWERVALGLRTLEGVRVEDLIDAEPIVAELVEQGLLEPLGRRWVATLRGWLLADAIARRLLFGAASSAAQQAPVSPPARAE